MTLENPVDRLHNFKELIEQYSRRPNSLTAGEASALAQISAQVSQLLASQPGFSSSHFSPKDQPAHLVQSIADGLVAVNREWRITYANARAAQNGPFTPEQLIGQNFWDAFPGLAGTPQETYYRQAMANREPVQFEMKRTGQDLWYLVRVYPSDEGITVLAVDHTTDKQTETQLLAENLRYKALMEAIFEADPSGIAVLVGPELRLGYTNPAYRYIIPDPCSDPVGQPYTRVWSRANHHVHVERFREVLATGRPYQVTGVDHHFPDGSTRSFSLQARRITWEDQPAVLLILWDITELRQSSIEIKQANTRLHTVLGSIAELYAVFDREWRILDLNRVAEEHYFPGQPSGAMLGKNIWEALPVAVGGEFYQALHRAMETNQPIHLEAGSRVTGNWYELHAYPRGGQLELYMHDITQRKKAEQGLEHYRLLFERSRDIFLTVRVSDGRILEANPAAEQAYGYTRDELLRLRVTDLRVLGTQPLGDYQLQQANTSGVLFETRHRDKAGRTFPVEVSSRTAEWNGEQVIMSVIRDIAERKAIQDLAVQKSAEAKAAALEAQRQAAELEALFTQMTDGVVVYDLNGISVRANATVVHAYGFDPTGLTPEEVARRFRVSRLDGSPWKPEEFIIYKALHGETVTDVRLKVVTADGRVMLLSASGNPICNSGQITGAVISYHDITEQARLEAEYRHQKTLLDAIFEADPSGLAVLTGPELRFAFANPTYLKLIPGPGADPFGKPYEQVFGRGGYEADLGHFREVLQSGQTYRVTGIERQLPDGSWRSFTLQARRIEWETQAAVLVILWDTTEIDRTQKALRASEARLNRAQEIAHLGSWELDVATQHLTWSDEVYRIFGITPQVFPATYAAFLDNVHPDDRAAVDAAYTRSIQEGLDSYEIEHRVVRRSTGEIRVVHEKCEHIRDASGKIVRSIGMVQDITERKESEARIQQLNQALALRASELEAERERWQGVVEGIADEVWVCDLDGKMSLINLPNTTRMGLDEFERKSYAQVLEELDITDLDGRFRPAEAAPLLRSLKGEIVRGEEMMRHRATGRIRYRQFSSAPMRDGQGAITGSVAIVRDITDFKQAEEEAHHQGIQIELQRRLLEQREQERLQVARDLHDGPVQELLGALYTLEGMIQGGVEDIQRSGIKCVTEILRRQINELRSYAGELRPPTLGRFGLEKAIRSHLDSWQEKHPEIQVEFECDQSEDMLPEAFQLPLFRIYQEILNNTVKHAQANHVKVCLEKNVDGITRLAVEDDGQGFEVPQDWLEVARAGHLGLVGMRERAEAIGGRLLVTSSPGHGARVLVTVPRNRSGG